MTADGDELERLRAAMFRGYCESTDAYVSCIDRQRRIVFMNRTLSRSTGEVLSTRVEEFVAEEHRPAVLQSIEAAFVSGSPHAVEFDAVLSDGSRKSFEARIVPFRGPDGEPLAMLTSTDLSDQRRLAEELSRSEELRKLIVENLPDFVVLLDRDRRFRWVNRLAPGLTLERVIGARIDEFVSPTALAPMRSAIEGAFAGRAGRFEIEGYGDGNEQAWYVTRVVPVSAGAAQDNVLLITTDITYQRRASLALRASEERFRVLFEHSPDYIAVITPDGAIEFLNRAPSGRTLEDVIGHSVDEFVRPEERDRVRSVFASVFSTGKPGVFETKALNAEDVYRVRIAPLSVAEGPARVLAVVTDITQSRADELARESLQAQLHQAQRRESIGTLAGGIAHDFNNLLQVIQSNLDFAREAVEPHGVALDELKAAMRATERAAELTTHLLAIGRRPRVDPQSVDLSRLIERSLRMLRRVIPENIELVYEPAPEPCSVSADPPQLEQVLLNLCLNARDAMPSGGRLVVSVRARARTAELSVVDNGSGITPEQLKRVFEPFFTTKGAGSGLGLAVAAGIVAAHGGSIAVSSEVGKGSSFVVELPLVAPVSSESDITPRPREDGVELILVAEDEPLVRAQLVRTLRRAGYAVLEADNGVRAVELYKANQERIGLVLLDVIMPGLDGWQVFSRLELLCPSVKVVFITGYAADALPQDFHARGKRLLSKPYESRVLLALVREMLDGE